MKFLNHLDLVENEARRLKMYRVSSAVYTPGITTSGNIIMDTASGANIPKWWDGSAWRDFSYNTTGGVNTTYTTSVPSGTTKIRLTGSDSTTDDIELAIGTGFMTLVRTNDSKITLNNETYNISVAAPTTSVSGKNASIKLNTNATGLIDEVGIQGTTYISNAVVNSGTFSLSLSAVDGTLGSGERFLSKSNKWVTLASMQDGNTNTQNAYAVSAADGTNTSREKIVLTGSGAAGATTDFVEIGAGTGLSIARSGDVITLTNTVTDTNDNTQNAYSTSIPTSTTKLRLTGSGAAGATTDDIEFVGSGATSVTRTSASKFTIGSTNTQYSALTNTTLGLAKTAHAALNNTSLASVGESAAGRVYGIQKNTANQLVVQVPWANTQIADTNTVTSIRRDNTGTYRTGNINLVGGTNVTITESSAGVFSFESTDTTTDVDVSNENLITRLAALESPNGTTNETIIIGADAGDTIKITGNLEVAGSTTTINTETVTIQDNILVLNSNSANTPTENAGLEVERGSASNVNIQWVESSDTWYLTESSTNANGGSIVSKKIIQNLFSTVTGNSGTATANSATTALAITGSNGITTTASNQGITISSGSAPSSAVISIPASSVASASNKIAQVTHALATKDVIVRTYLINTETSQYEEIYTDVVVVSTTAIRLTFSANFPTGYSNCRVVITGVKFPATGTSVAYS
tara:strand:- start:467 stop:2554 length:2088 start_codon:yes stop_codon:yes gene_type:complete